MDSPSDMAFWAAAAADYLRPLFAAAILGEGGARAVATWITCQDFTGAEEILRARGLDVHANRLAELANEPPLAAVTIRAVMLAAVSR